MREKDIEARLRDGVKRLGGIAYKWVSPGQAGVPDRIVIMPNRALIFVELKTDEGRLSNIQKAQIHCLQELGQNVVVLYGLKDVLWFLDALKSDAR